jgi:hypothetical protein
MTRVSNILESPINNFVFLKIDNLNDWYFDSLFRVRTLSSYERPKRRRLAEKVLRRGQCVWGLSILILTVVGVEKIIAYNDLSPQNDISKPGQIIPLVLGIITVLEGIASAVFPERLPEPSSSMALASVSTASP